MTRLLILMTVLLAAPSAFACTNAGRYGWECPPFTVCSIYAGDCYSCGPQHVCCGACQMGLTWRVLPKVGLFAASEGSAVGAALGVEIVPPLSGGHLSLQAEWWSDEGLRFGPVFSFPATDWLLLGFSVDFAARPMDDPAWSAGGALRAEFFPLARCGCSWLSQFALLVEAGSTSFLAQEDPRFFGLLGLRYWI